MDATEKNVSDFRERLHYFNKDGGCCGVNLLAVAEYVKETTCFFVSKGVFYVYSGGVYLPDMDGVEMWGKVKNCLYPQFVKPDTISKILKLLVMEKDCYISDDSKLNNFDRRSICFKNGMYSPVTNVIFEHNPKYNCINQIPFAYTPGVEYKGKGKYTDDFLSFAIPNPDDREMFLEFLGLSLTFDTRQQVFLLLTGTGNTGKSTLISMIEYIVGRANISNVPLEKIGDRFNSSQLYGKLLNSCGDLSIDALGDVSILKKLVGEDSIFAERKGRDGFSFYNYARLLFSVNGLPIVKAEKTNGFYRRLLIIEMNNTPKKKDASLMDKLKGEADYFLFLIVEALRRLYARGEILVSEGSRKATAEMWAASDSVQAFLSDMCEKGTETDRIERSKLFEAYTKYCQRCERTALTRNSFYSSVKVKGFGVVKSNGIVFFRGVKFQELPFNNIKDGENCPFFDIKDVKEKERIAEMFGFSG